MGILRPATPGFLVTLAATVCLAIVVFCVPYFKSIYFLKASFTSGDLSGYITLGTLGYCFSTGGSTTCSKAAVGYEFDPNKLLGNNLPVQIPAVAVKWLTYALVLHVVALGLAAIASVFGLLAHVREMSMSCLSSCISGLGAFVTLVAFAFDLAFFFIAKSRINKVQGGSAQIGTAVWLTLVAWILLFFSGCFYSVGRCCVGNRPGRSGGGGSEGRHDRAGSGRDTEGGIGRKNVYAEDMRLEAVKAEADRKARAAAAPKEVGLPAFQEYERTPLNPQTTYVDEDHLYSDHPQSPVTGDHGVGSAVAAGAAGAAVGAAAARRQPSGYSPSSSRITRQPSNISNVTNAAQYPGGYAGGAPGTRAVDNYYNSTPSPAQQQPPQRQASYDVGAVYGSPSTTAPQPSGLYGEPNYQPQYNQTLPAQSNYVDPYGGGLAHGDAYDPYAAPTRPNPNVYNSTYTNGQSSYYTANDATPRGPGPSSAYGAYDSAYNTPTPQNYGAPNSSTTPAPLPLGAIPQASYQQPNNASGYFGSPAGPPQHPTRTPSSTQTTPTSPTRQATAMYGARPQRQPSSTTPHTGIGDWNPIAGAARTQSPPQIQPSAQYQSYGQPQAQTHYPAQHTVPSEESAYGGMGDSTSGNMSTESEALPSYHPYEASHGTIGGNGSDGYGGGYPSEKR